MIVLVILLIGAGVAGWLLLRDDGDQVAGAGEIFLEPAAAQGRNSFTNAFFAEDPPEQLAPTLPTEEARITPRINVSFDAHDGAEPGLYGGTRDQTRCDPEMLITFLQSETAKASAWVAALNADPSLRWSGGSSLTVADIADYIDELTPVDLRDDTRVTNHGYADGAATPHQSVLEAGTAVLVDVYGIPRVRCACGNPLRPPIAVPTGAVYTGPVWRAFDPALVVVINQTVTVINTFVLTDIETNNTFTRPAGSAGGDDSDAGATATPTPTRATPTPTPTPTPTSTGLPSPTPSETMTLPPDIVVGTGDVQVTLIWDNDSDFDLHVFDPDGTEIYFAATTSPSGGMLDRDDVPPCGDNSTHVENIFWPTGGAPSGTYTYFVRHFRSCGAEQSFQLTVTIGGEQVIVEQGTLAGGEDSEPGTFEVS